MLFLQSETVQRRVYKSLKLWSMYADLEESLGTFQVTMCVLYFSIFCNVIFKNSMLQKILKYKTHMYK